MNHQLDYHASPKSPTQQPTQSTLQFINSTFPNNNVNVQPLRFQPFFNSSTCKRKQGQKRDVSAMYTSGETTYTRNTRKATGTTSPTVSTTHSIQASNTSTTNTTVQASSSQQTSSEIPNTNNTYVAEESNFLSKTTCTLCKKLHKKCDKVLPSCSYCVKRKKGCSYEHKNNSVNNTLSDSANPPLNNAITSSLSDSNNNNFVCPNTSTTTTNTLQAPNSQQGSTVNSMSFVEKENYASLILRNHACCAKEKCPYCDFGKGNKKKKTPLEVAEHIVKRHMNAESVGKVCSSTYEALYKTNFDDIVKGNYTTDSRRLETTSDGLNVTACKLVSQKINAQEYDKKYMINVVRCIAEGRIPVNKMHNLFSAFQKLFFDDVQLPIPSVDTIY